MRKLPFASALFIAASVFPLIAGQAQSSKVITVHAKRYAFLPAEITVTKGQPVTLRLISDDVAHGLAIRGLDLHADMPKGKPVNVTVTPAETGDFVGTCSRFCGAGHGSMKLVVHVVDAH